METNFLGIISDILPADLKKFLLVIDEFTEKTPRVWQQLATDLGGRYSPERLERLYVSLCDHMGEPRNTTTLSMRFLYEMPLSVEDFRGFPFMNLGYHPTPDGPPIQELELTERDRKFQCNSALYRLWLKSSDITGKEVVEVGSGRGGGGSFLTRYFKPRSYTGVDGSRQQVAHCTEAYAGHAHPGLRFAHGLATAIPLQDSSVDLVLNVESSHCYSDLDKFFFEVHRVLRKGGTFVLTDILYRKAQIFPYLNTLDRYFHVRGKTDITKNVLACLELHGPDQFLNYLEGMGGRVRTSQPTNRDLLMTSARVFLPMMDNAPFANYRALSTSGEALYVSFRCERKG
ncbi:class I SAM-dependent methyltransferase [Pendulispora brunnea]|uniref:Class I SAM-dependent methyltransferase n=1 Tax=Pendulispora brunnea TaxID=2905690 RepID=A0ABZ2KJT7_9BACT